MGRAVGECRDTAQAGALIDLKLMTCKVADNHVAGSFPVEERAFQQTDLVYLPNTFLISPTFFWALPSI